MIDTGSEARCLSEGKQLVSPVRANDRILDIASVHLGQYSF